MMILHHYTLTKFMDRYSLQKLKVSIIWDPKKYLLFIELLQIL